MTSVPVASPDDAAALAVALTEHGACRLPGFTDEAATGRLREALQLSQSAGGFHPAQVGRGDAQGLHAGIRGDSTAWIDGHSGPAATAYLAALESLRLQLNQRLFLGMQEVEAHFACYPPGSRYRRHRDRFHDSDARVLSFVTYLNRDWQRQEGGALRLYLSQGAVDVLPQDALTVCFLSSIEHEVLPATRERLSIAAWMRTLAR